MIRVDEIQSYISRLPPHYHGAASNSRVDDALVNAIFLAGSDPMSDEEFKLFCACLLKPKNCKSLTIIASDRLPISETKTLQALPLSITSLSLQGFKDSETLFAGLIVYEALLSKLVSLDLANSEIDQSTFESLLKGATNLSSLTLPNGILFTESLKAILVMHLNRDLFKHCDFSLTIGQSQLTLQQINDVMSSRQQPVKSNELQWGTRLDEALFRQLTETKVKSLGFAQIKETLKRPIGSVVEATVFRRRSLGGPVPNAEPAVSRFPTPNGSA